MTAITTPRPLGIYSCEPPQSFVIEYGASKKHSFSVRYVLHVPEDVESIQKIDLVVSTYIKTSAKIKSLQGARNLLIISDSPHIGSVQAETVVLNNSKASKVSADYIYMVNSFGRMCAKKGFEAILPGPPSGMLMQTFNTTTGFEGSLQCDQGKINLVIEKGSISKQKVEHKHNTQDTPKKKK